MKIALLSDIHMGVRKNSEIFLSSQLRFIEEQFVPYLKDNGISDVFILGDLFDNRNSTNTKVMNAVYDLFDKHLIDFNVRMIVGNHDCYFNSTVEINSLKFLEKFKNVQLVEKITETTIDGKKIVMVPWVTDNLSFVREFLQIENIDLCFGHFNISGFNFNKFKKSDDGIQGKIFANCKKVFTGHFHIRNSQNIQGSDIVYIGSPFQLTRNDIDENRGFVILDTDNLEYKHIDNTVSLKYIKLKYPEKFTLSKIKNNIIDVYVDYDETYSESKVDKYVKKIEEYSPISPPNIFVENNSDLNGNIDLKNYKFGSMLDLMREYIDGLDIGNKEEINQILIELYNDSTKGDSV